jgi:hypothetical protein
MIAAPLSGTCCAPSVTGRKTCVMSGPGSTWFKTASSMEINRLLAFRLGQDPPMRLISSCVPMTSERNTNRIDAGRRSR